MTGGNDMAKSSITAFDVERIQETAGRLRKKPLEDEVIRMETARRRHLSPEKRGRKCGRQLGAGEAALFPTWLVKKRFPLRIVQNKFRPGAVCAASGTFSLVTA